MQRYAGYLAARSTRTLTILALALIVVLGGIDIITGHELSFSIFYLIPVSMAAWTVGKRLGLVIAVAAAGMWLGADLLANPHYSYAIIPYWNAGVRLSFFVVVTFALAGLHAAQTRQEELSHFIVHDLRSPLGVIMMGLRTLQEFDNENLTPDQQRVITLCLSSCDRQLILINSILDLARLESGQMPLQQTSVNVEDVTQAAVAPLQLWGQQRKIALSTHIDAGVTAVYADPVLLERILVNLLGNAIKFTRENSEVTVHAGVSEPGVIAFSVRDQGPGIPVEWADKVFEKFAQTGNGGGSGKKYGSGLGLHFCRLAVEAQGGRIWINSQIDQGTVITFTLPDAGPTP